MLVNGKWTEDWQPVQATDAKGGFVRQVSSFRNWVTPDGSAGPTPVHIGPTEYRLLHFFMTHPERVFSRGQLLDNVWGTNVYIEERTVDVHIRRLRQSLAPSGHDRLVQTVRGAGYRFSAQG